MSETEETPEERMRLLQEQEYERIARDHETMVMLFSNWVNDVENNGALGLALELMAYGDEGPIESIVRKIVNQEAEKNLASSSFMGALYGEIR